MADHDQLQRLDDEIRALEYHAVRMLAEHLREKIRYLPSESKLGLIFLQHANNLDACAEERTPSLGPNHYLGDIERELRDLDGDDREGE
jgi:hypothetical protein